MLTTLNIANLSSQQKNSMRNMLFKRGYSKAEIETYLKTHQSLPELPVEETTPPFVVRSARDFNCSILRIDAVEIDGMSTWRCRPESQVFEAVEAAVYAGNHEMPAGQQLDVITTTEEVANFICDYAVHGNRGLGYAVSRAFELRFVEIKPYTGKVRLKRAEHAAVARFWETMLRYNPAIS